MTDDLADRMSQLVTDLPTAPGDSAQRARQLGGLRSQRRTAGLTGSAVVVAVAALVMAAPGFGGNDGAPDIGASPATSEVTTSGQLLAASALPESQGLWAQMLSWLPAAREGEGARCVGGTHGTVPFHSGLAEQLRQDYWAAGVPRNSSPGDLSVEIVSTAVVSAFTLEGTAPQSIATMQNLLRTCLGSSATSRDERGITTVRADSKKAHTVVLLDAYDSTGVLVALDSSNRLSASELDRTIRRMKEVVAPGGIPDGYFTATVGASGAPTHEPR